MDAAVHNEHFPNQLVFSDEETFHLSGKVNRHIVRIWGSENSHAYIEHVRDSPKVNVFCAVYSSKVYGPFFFAEKTVSGITYLDMLKIWLFPQLKEDMQNFIFQQDGAPPHWYLEVRKFLNNELPQHRIGRSAAYDLVLQSYPPRSPDLAQFDFFLWGYVKDCVFIPPLPTNVPVLKQHICDALQTVNSATLQRVWQEMAYRIDIIRVTKGSHIEHL